MEKIENRSIRMVVFTPVSKSDQGMTQRKVKLNRMRGNRTETTMPHGVPRYHEAMVTGIRKRMGNCTVGPVK